MLRLRQDEHRQKCDGENHRRPNRIRRSASGAIQRDEHKRDEAAGNDRCAHIHQIDRELLEGIVPDWLISANGTLLILFSAFCFVAAVWRNLNPGPPPPVPSVPQIRPWLLIAVNGFLALVSLATLVPAVRRRAVGSAV